MAENGMNLPPLRIGGVTVAFPVVLAPMAGYTDTAMRELCMRYRAGASYTEVVNAEALVRGSKLTLHMLETSACERPVCAHLYGSKPDVMARAAAMAESLGRFDFIDINCGCPVRKIVAKGSGAALMRDPAKVERIVRAVKDAVSLPVTVKTRTGLTPECLTVFDILNAVEQGGGDAIAVHARVASLQHRGPADWARLAEVKQRARIPVIGNGGVARPGDVFRMVAETGVDGVMIGRGAVGNPWIFEEAYALAHGQPYAPHTFAEHRAAIVEQLGLLVAYKRKEQLVRRRARFNPEATAALLFRAHLFKYLSGFGHWADVRRGLNEMASPEQVLHAVDLVMARQPPGFRIQAPAPERTPGPGIENAADSSIR